MGAEQISNQPFLPATPAEALGPLVRERVIVEGRTFVIDRPRNTAGLLDHPTVRSAFETDGFMPYWSDLWPAAHMLAKAVLREPWTPGLQALEVGCGLGLPGIAGLSMGLHVIFSDYDATALAFAANNALANGLDRFETLQLDWRHPPSDLRVPVMLASDLVYETRNVAPLSFAHQDGLAAGRSVPVDRSGPGHFECFAEYPGSRRTDLHHSHDACWRTKRTPRQGHFVPHHAPGLGGDKVTR